MLDIVLLVRYTHSKFLEHFQKIQEVYNIQLDTIDKNASIFDNIKDKKNRWLVVLDQTCIISDFLEVVNCINYMKENSITVMGIPDGGYYTIHFGSPYILNHNFNIIACI